MGAAANGPGLRDVPSALDLLRPSRRQLLKTGVAGCAVLAAAGVAAGNRAPARATARDDGYAVLAPAHGVIIAALAPVMLDGALPADGAMRDAAIAEVVAGVDRAAAGLPPATQAELRQLLDLLDLAPARIVVAGLWRSWETAEAADIAAALRRWRGSWFGVLRSAYLSLHELIVAAWYGNPASWPRIGYPGPPDLG